MSMTDRLNELMKEANAFRSALNAIIEYEEIDHAVALGVSRQLIADGDTSKLTDKQLNVFKQHILPLLNPKCGHIECLGGGSISMSDLAEAYGDQFELGGLYCEECRNREFRMQDAMSDD
ncbi:MAG: hypothetical protein AB7D51_11495 [Desulfovibrionaceae bacterium]